MSSAPGPSEDRRRERRERLSVAAGLVVSAALLVWALHDVDLGEALRHARGADLSLLAAAVGVATLTLPMRALRWRLILRPRGREQGFSPLFRSLAIGIMGNNVLPARTGEVVRAYAAGCLTESPLATALASIAVERAMDLVAILALLAVALAAGGDALPVSAGGIPLMEVAAIAAVVATGLLCVALGVGVWPERARSAGAGVASGLGRFAPALERTLLRVVSNLVDGLTALGRPGLAASTAAWTVGIWLTNALAFWIGLLAFGIDVPWTAPLVLQSLVALGIALPSSPAFFGPFEAAARVALGLYGVEATRAISFAFSFHIVGYFLPVVVIGFAALARSPLTLSSLRQEQRAGT